jgi:hypothetical protein
MSCIVWLTPARSIRSRGDYGRPHRVRDLDDALFGRHCEGMENSILVSQVYVLGISIQNGIANCYVW